MVPEYFINLLFAAPCISFLSERRGSFQGDADENFKDLSSAITAKLVPYICLNL